MYVRTVPSTGTGTFSTVLPCNGFRAKFGIFGLQEGTSFIPFHDY